MWGLRILCTKLHAKVYIPHLFPQHPSTLSDFSYTTLEKIQSTAFKMMGWGVGKVCRLNWPRIVRVRMETIPSASI